MDTEVESFGSANVLGVFAGGLTVIAESGHLTGMCKKRREGPVQVDVEGLVGDQIADPRFHGGPDKAVHLYPVEHYAQLQAAFSATDEPFGSGAFGENLSLVGLSEEKVCIGDMFSVGSVVLQLTQPRTPCWKLNARFGVPALSRHIQDARMTGWYARVLQPGIVTEGDMLTCVGRQQDACSVAAFWDQVLAPEPDIDLLQMLAETEGLADDWCRRLTQRVRWLRERTNHSECPVKSPEGTSPSGAHVSFPCR